MTFPPYPILPPSISPLFLVKFPSFAPQKDPPRESEPHHPSRSPARIRNHHLAAQRDMLIVEKVMEKWRMTGGWLKKHCFTHIHIINMYVKYTKTLWDYDM